MHILRHRLFVKKEEITKKQIEQFRYVLFNKNDEQHDLIETFKVKQSHYAFCRGDMGKIYDIWDEEDIKDQRVIRPFNKKYNLIFTGNPNIPEEERNGLGDLRKEQDRVLDEWLEHEYGMIKAPPRWGKSVWLVALTTILKQKTLILAHTQDLLNQLEEEFRGWTNINELEEEHEKKLIGKLGTGKGKKKKFYPLVTLSTWQYLNRNLKTLKKKSSRIGLIAVDEAHRVSSECFTKVVNNTNSYYRLGITATPKIKSGHHVIAFDIMGPVVAEGKEEQLPIDIFIQYTGEEFNPNKGWAKLLTDIANNKRRNKFIANLVVDDVLDDDRVVLVTTDRKKHCTDLEKMILDICPDLTTGVITSSTSDSKRKKIREGAKLGEIDVVIAMNSIIQEGWNVPRLSALHNTMPIINDSNWYQRISRPRTKYTPVDDNDTYEKPTPICRVYLDEYGEDGKGIHYGYLNCIKRNATQNDFEIKYVR